MVCVLVMVTADVVPLQKEWQRQVLILPSHIHPFTLSVSVASRTYTHTYICMSRYIHIHTLGQALGEFLDPHIPVKALQHLTCDYVGGTLALELAKVNTCVSLLEKREGRERVESGG